MNDFRSSTGIPVWIFDGILRVANSDSTYPASVAAGDHTNAIREFFLAERDETLGRWRYDEWAVVYPSQHAEGYVSVVREKFGQSTTVHRDRMDGVHDDWAVPARAYFAAHPEPKPWDDAAIGDIWVLTGAGGLEQPWRKTSDGRWLAITSRGIYRNGTDFVTAGRRIWPEGV